MNRLLTLQCRHDYFADGICHALGLVPTAACARQLACYQLLFRPQPGGGAVYYQDGISALDDYTDTTPLSFWLCSSDAALASYTQLAPPGKGGFYFTDNLTATPDADGTLQLGLDGAVPYFAPGTPPPGAWGMVAFYLGGKARAVQFPILAPDGTAQPGNYAITLAALKLPWRYNIVAEAGIAVDWTDYTLVATPAGQAPVTFTGRAGPPIDARAVYQFVSNTAMALAERPGTALAVQLRPSARAHHLLPLSLAYPEPRNIRKDGDVHYADVYVHL